MCLPKKHLFLLTVCLVFCFTNISQAEVIPTNYFEVNLHKGVDVHQLHAAINWMAINHVDTLYSNRANSPADLLKNGLDALYLEVSDILDIHMHDVQVKMEVVANKADLKKLLGHKFALKNKDVAFYVHYENTIYVSQEAIDIGILGHEIAHAIISHYFVVPPPGKLQEVLCGYVDFKLKKRAKLSHMD